MTEPYERQPKEGDKAWLWFRIYRDLLHNRSQQEVIDYTQDYNKRLQQYLEQQKMGQSRDVFGTFPYGLKKLPEPTPKNLRNLSSIHHWKKRAHAYDKYLDQQQREAREQEFIEEEKKYLQLMGDTLSATQQYITVLNEDVDPRIRTTSKLHAIRSASQSIDTLYKDLRLAYGKSTENKDTNINADVSQEVSVPGGVDINHQLTSKEFHKDELDYLRQLMKKE